MRLRSIETGQRPLARLKLGAVSVATMSRAPDILRVFLYRPEFFGKDCLRQVQEVLRGPSEWTVGERELFAAFVSKTNNCSFCAESHQAIARQALGADVVEAALNDWRSAPVSESVRATLGFLEKLTLRPGDVTGEDVQRVRDAQVSQVAVEKAIDICALFCTINRIADALGFEVPSVTAFNRMGSILLKHGYRF